MHVAPGTVRVAPHPALGTLHLAPVLLSLFACTPLVATDVIVLKSIGGLPAHVAGVFEEPLAFQQTTDGRFLVLDRRAHTVYRVDADRSEATRLVQVGYEEGRLLQPTAFDADPSGTFVVADAPNRRERVQIFNIDGERVGGFSLPGRASPRVTLGNLVLSGVGSLQFTGRSVLINQPETGALVTEYGLAGSAVRTFGRLRPTGQEADRDVHLALNSGFPIVDPRGGFYFVFQAGEPRFRKYDQNGELVFERVAQGRDLDGVVSKLPSTWPRRNIDGNELPFVAPVVRAAAVDLDGGVWMTFVTLTTHRYDADGDKVASYRFQGAGPVVPTSLFFTKTRRLLITPGFYEFAVP